MIDVEHAIYCAVQDLRDAAEGLVNHCEGEDDLYRRISEIEQLAERVRLGKAWFVCKVCDGTGWQPHWYKKTKPHYTGKKCWRCNGTGLLNGLDATPNAPCPCHEPSGGPPCTAARPCGYAVAKGSRQKDWLREP